VDTQVIETAKAEGRNQRIARGILLWEVFSFVFLLVTAAVAGRFFIVSLSRALVEGIASGVTR
jgi:hypothetical protein